jgi:hypothetical protein
MSITLLYFGPQWPGSTSLQRLNAFQDILGEADAVGVDNGAGVGGSATLWQRIRWRLRLPVDVRHENEVLLTAVRKHSPRIVLVDNVKVIRRSTIKKMRELGAARIVYYTPDDIAAKHNLSLPLKWSLPEWDIVCTTKTFNVPELKAMGVERPLLVGKAFDPVLHRPWSADEVGGDYEKYDTVFIGTYERERCTSINALAEVGISVVVYGEDKGKWRKGLHPAVTLRPTVFDQEYVRAWHTGKVALCFLRKINRDRITQRTMEIAAIGRPMVAERTDEHDQHFAHGREYLGFHDDLELVPNVKSLLSAPALRDGLGKAGRRRCLESRYSTHDRARQMLAEFLS